MLDWDPIGVAGEPNAVDEYDFYIEPIRQLLVEGGAESSLYQYLYWVETVRMGLVDASGGALISKDHRERAVAALQRIFAEGFET